MKKIAITQEYIDFAMRIEFEEMKDHEYGRAWLEHLGVGSGEDLVRMRREGTLPFMDWKRSPPPTTETTDE